MKAKDYFAKYDEIIIDEQIGGSVKSTKQLLLDMSIEVKELCEIRHVKRDSAVIGVIKEMNQKWNAICSLYEKKYGVSPINRNAFIEYLKVQIPILKEML